MVFFPHPESHASIRHGMSDYGKDCKITANYLNHKTLSQENADSCWFFHRKDRKKQRIIYKNL